MPQIIVCEWRILFSENLLHKISYPVKDPCLNPPPTPQNCDKPHKGEFFIFIYFYYYFLFFVIDTFLYYLQLL